MKKPNCFCVKAQEGADRVSLAELLAIAASKASAQQFAKTA
jgi:hypothetical protein